MTGRREFVGGMIALTFPGLGGQQPPPFNSAPAGQLVPGVQPGVSGQIVARRVIIIGTGGELLVYSPTAAAGNLIASVAGAAFTDQYGNHGLGGVADYSNANGFATQLQSGFIQFYTGSLAGGWTSVATIQTSVTGGLFLATTASQINLTAATAVSTNHNTLDDGSGNMTVLGTLSVNGSTNTGSGNNGGVTSGPSGTVNAFPAAGPNHTHAEVHQHPL